jgi:dTMP kinase
MTFVTIEGLDGAGKSLVLDAIESEYPDATFTSEPSDFQTGKLLRQHLSDEESPALSDFYLFMADRVNHIENRVRPLAENGHLVVSGRYADSTRAYQPVALVNDGVFRSESGAKLFIEEMMDAWDYEPDLTIYLDISVDTAVERASGEEKYEKRQFLKDVRANYREVIQDFPERVRVVNAEQRPGQVRHEVLSLIKQEME